MHPLVPLEPWEPGDLGIPVCDGPKGSKLALIICHDGMLPEMAREAAYKGANVILRTAGYTDPLRHAWRITNQVNAFTNVAYTASVALAGGDATGIWSIGEAMICDIDGTVLECGDNSPDRIVTGEVIPARADHARRTWGVENNIYQLGHRGYVAVRGGARDCPYTYMTDLAAGRYRVPWEDEVEVTDGTSMGYGPPREP
jgi:formamidase